MVLTIMLNLITDFLGILYPDLCQACGNALFKYEKTICILCSFKLPRTKFHLEEDNPVSRVFWGRVKLENVCAFVYFSKKGRVQNLMHHFKYRNRKDIGFELGKLYGQDLKKAKWIEDIDVIIPVPLHKKKLKKRGFNQSEEIVKGLAESLEIPMNLRSLQRIKASETQTKKTRIQRWENVKDIFDLFERELLIDKHILLVDDVITTGATIEACAQKLLEIKGLKLSVTALAYPN